MKKIRYQLDVWVSSQGDILSGNLSRKDVAKTGAGPRTKSKALGGFSGGDATTAIFGDELDRLFRTIRFDLEKPIS